MLVLSLLLTCRSFNPPIDVLDKLAQARDVPGLSKYLASDTSTSHNPFRIIGTNGAYDVGRYGWKAVELKGIENEEMVVFTTPLTSEDTGELVFHRQGDKLQYIPEQESFGIKLVRHKFDLQFDVQAKKASLVDRLELKNMSGTNGSFLFRMSPQYVVSSIVNSHGNKVRFAEAGGVVSAEKPDGEDEYEIKYSAIVDLPNYAGSIGPKEATLTNDYWYPMVARQPVPYDITIHSPASWISIGQGDLVEEKTTGNQRITTYRMDLPCVFYSVSSGPFKKYHQEINGKWYSCWSTQLSPGQLETQTELYAPVIDFYSQFAPYPFKGYGAIDSMVYGGGALEAYSFTTWGHGALPGEDAHEPAHSWWGGIINNSYLGSFWNESFAVFSEGLFRRNVKLGNVQERKLAFIREGNADKSYMKAAIAESGADVGGIGSSLGYGKGSQVLQMLEQVIGTDQMMRSMQAWIKKCSSKLSDWNDYEAVVTSLNSGKDIKGFFDDWIRKPGYAEIEGSNARYGDGKVSINVSFKGESYQIPLEVMLQFPDGSRSFHMVVVRHSGPIEIATAKKPTLISLDPWRRILRTIASDETPIQLNQLTSAYPRFTDKSHPEYLAEVRGNSRELGIPSDPAGKFLVGHPSSSPLIAKLCEKVGFKVTGNHLTYDGTTIDLTRESAMAVVDLGGNKNCVIGLGTTRIAPDFGRARLVITDSLGRFLRGKTEPKSSGSLVFKIQ